MAVRKRKIHAEKKVRRILAAALACVCTLAAGTLVLLNRYEQQIVDLPRSESTAVVYQTRAVDDIASLTVENTTGSYTITQTDGVCSLLGRPDFVFSETMLQDVLTNAAVIVTEETIAAVTENEWKHYGLASGAVRVTVTYTDGETIVFRIGDLLPQETPLYYFRAEGDNRLGAISQDVQEIFTLSVNALHRVTDPALKGDLIDRIAFAGENPFAIERRAEGWYMTAPFGYPLSTTQVNTLLKNLENLRFSQYVCPAEGADLSPYGLDRPRRTLTLSIAESILTGYNENGQAIASQQLDGYELTFDCGDDIGDILFYCLYRGDVMKATRFSSGLLLTQSYEKLLLTQPFNIPTNQLTRLEWQQNGVTHTFELSLVERIAQNGDFERDESNNILYDVLVNGSDADSFLLAYARLTDVKTTDALPVGYVLPEDAQPEAVIRLYTETALREVAFYPYDALHWAVSVDGTPRFYVSCEALNNVNMI